MELPKFSHLASKNSQNVKYIAADKKGQLLNESVASGTLGNLINSSPEPKSPSRKVIQSPFQNKEEILDDYDL